MSAHSSDERTAILEANLQALFARAYQPLPIRAGFTAQVQRSAAAILQRGPAPSVRFSTLALAAAAAFLIAAFGLAAWLRSDFARDRILERHQIAVRMEHGGWSGLDAAQEPARVSLDSGALEIVVPVGRDVVVTGAPSASALLGPAHAIFDRSGNTVGIDLLDGGLGLRGFQGRVRGEFGSFECSAADLDLSCDEHGSVRAWLGAGHARFESVSGERHDLALERRFEPRPTSSSTLAAGVLLGAAPVDLDGLRRALPLPSSVSLQGVARRTPLSGSVHTFAGGTPPKFRVILLREVELPLTARPSSAEFEDGSGHFQFDSIEDGAWTVFVQADGFALWTRSHVRLGGAADAQLEVLLDSGASVTGRALDAATGRPLADVQIASESDLPLSLLPFDFNECSDNPAALARTDADGRFRFEHLTLHSTVLRATRRGYGASWSNPFVPGTDEAELTLELSRGGSLAGRVEREDGSAWVAAGIVAMPQRSLTDLPRRSLGWAVTDAAGTFRIDDLPAGDYVAVRVEVTQRDAAANPTPGREPRAEVREVTIHAGAVQSVNFLAPPRGSRLAGHVLHIDRTPLASGTISIMPEGSTSNRADGAPDQWRSQLCGVDGAFEFTDVLPGRYEIFLGVRTPMDIVQVDSIEVGTAANVDREIVAPLGLISGRVRSAANARGVQFAAIIVEREQAQGAREFVAKVFSDESGSWRVPHLKDGTYRVGAYPNQGLAYAGRAGIEIRAGVAVEQVDFELEAGSALTLALSDRDALPLAGVQVQLFDEAGLEFNPARDPRTDAKGLCKFEGLPSGRTRVVVRGPAGSTSERWILVQAPAPLALEFQLPEARVEATRK